MTFYKKCTHEMKSHPWFYTEAVLLPVSIASIVYGIVMCVQGRDYPGQLFIIGGAGVFGFLFIVSKDKMEKFQEKESVMKK